MLDETFGVEAMKRFVQALAETKSWSTCATNKEISDMLLDATLSPVSRKNFFQNNNFYSFFRTNLQFILENQKLPNFTFET